MKHNRTSDDVNDLHDSDCAVHKAPALPVADCDCRADVTIAICSPPCDHDFQGWREFADGRGGEAVCTKCGIGAMAWSLRTGI